MEENNTLEILKNAILLEKRGQVFYQKVAEQTHSKPVKDFFEMMAFEEVKHVKIIADQYKSYKKNHHFKEISYEQPEGNDMASEILNKELKEKISGAGFESAAISAAISMEDRAVKFYADRAKASDDPEEKKMYEWLADWERGHLNILLDMDRDLTKKIWNDNQFWPF
jgi:rubrerythrin